MEYDIIRIKTLPKGERVGQSISSEFESKTDHDYTTYDQKLTDEILNRLNSKEYLLENVDKLADGDYSRELFEEIPYAANFVPEGEPVPISKAKPLLMYIGDKTSFE